NETGIECRWFGPGEMGVNGPVFNLLERLDFALTFDDEPQRPSRDAAGRQAAPYLVPKQRGNLVAHQAVEHAPSLLRVHPVLVDVARMLESLLYGALGDLFEGHATDAVGLVAILLLLFLLLSVAQFFGQVPGDGFAFAVRVGRQIDVVRGQGQLLQLGENLLLAGDDYVFRLEFVVDIDAQRALGQVFDVPERSFDGEALPQIFLDGLGLGRRLDDD